VEKTQNSPGNSSWTTGNTPQKVTRNEAIDDEYSSVTTVSDDKIMKNIQGVTAVKTNKTAQVTISKRNSLWRILLQNAQRTINKAIDSNNLDSSNNQATNNSQGTDHDDDELQTCINNPSPSLSNNENNCEINCKVKKTERRRKSLSVPSLPNFVLQQMQESDNWKSSIMNAEVPEVSCSKELHKEFSVSNLKIQRSRSAYYKRKGETSKALEDVSPLKTNTSWSLKIQPNKEQQRVSSTLHKHNIGDESQPRSRTGTTARKIQDRKSKARRKQHQK